MNEEPITQPSEDFEISDSIEYDINGEVRAVGKKVKRIIMFTVLNENELDGLDAFYDDFIEEIQLRDVFDNDNLKSPHDGSYSYAFHIYYQSFYGDGVLDYIDGDSFRGGFKNSLYLSYKTALQEIYRWYENYEIKQVIITGLAAEELKVPESSHFMQKGCHENFKKGPYFVVGSKTKKNCFWIAVSIASKKEPSKELLTINKRKSDNGYKLKKKLNHLNYDSPTSNTIKELANHYGRSIEIYDSNLKLKEKYDSIDGKNLKKDSIKIMDIDGHAFALNSLNFVKKNYPDLISEKYIEEQSEKEFKPIKFDEIGYERKRTSIDKIISWDLETTTKLFQSRQIPYMCGYAFKDEDEKIKFKSFEGEGCIRAWMEELYENRFFFNNYTLFAHNGSKFDILFLLYNYLHVDNSKWIISNLCYHNNRVINLKIFSKDRKCNLSFLDSYLFLCGSLDRVGNELHIKHLKKKDVDHSKICFENYTQFPELKEYFVNDVVGLYEIVEIYGKTCLETNGLDLTRFMTGPSLAMNGFLKNYYDVKRTPLFTPSIQFDDYIRFGYEGGRNEAFTIGKKTGKFIYLDYTSLYPYVGTFDLPYGRGEFLDLKKLQFFIKDGLLQDDFFGFVRVKVKHTKFELEKLNLIGFKSEKHQNRLIFPFLENAIEKVMFSEVIKFAQKNNLNYEFEFLDAIKYQKSPVLRKYFQENFEKRKEAKKRGNDAEVQKRKIDMNSTYGKTGESIKNRKTVKISKKVPDFRKHLKEGNLISLLKTDKYYYEEFFQHEIGKFCCVGIAAAITAYAQLQLFKFMNDLTKLGYFPEYCDTDSVVVDKFSFKNHPDLKEKYSKEDGINLGELKNEFEDKAKKALPKDEFEKLKKNDELYFDQLIILGNKSYIFTRKIGNVLIKSQAQKGISESLRPKLEDYEKIIEKKVFTPGFEDEKKIISEIIEIDGKETKKVYVNNNQIKEELINGKKRKYYEEEYEVNGKKKIRKCCPKEVGQTLFRTSLNNILIENKELQGIRIEHIKKNINLKYYKGVYSEDEIKKFGYSKVKPLKI